jgi:hypothetical protein
VSRRNAVTALAGLAAALAVAVQPAFAAVSITYSVVSGTPGNNGWYLSNVTVSIQTPGATSSNCQTVVTFQSSSDTYQCSATDGTATPTLQLQFKIDKDLPVVTAASADRAPNGNGWYNAPVTVTFTGTDATSGIASCTQTTYSGPDSGSATVNGTCTDVAGNVSAPFPFNFKYDATPPTVTGTPARPPDADGWYNHPVAVAFAGSDATSGIDSCTSATYGGPDNAGATVTGTCVDKAGNSAGGSLTLQYDSTAPTVKAALARPPDANGWYNHPVALVVSGTDATSGIASCSGGVYSGPEDASAALTATCTDHAGNSTSRQVTFKYDATPPKLTNVSVTSGNGTATVRWTAPTGTTSVMAQRATGTSASLTTVYKGVGTSFTDSKLHNGAKYRYLLSVTDEAGLVWKVSLTVEPRALTQPSQGQKVKKPPLLRWIAVPGADYYNIQLFLKGHKVLSEWPVGRTFKLPKTWKYGGHTYSFGKGHYRWYVWPGYGPRNAAKYGKLLGTSVFVAS